MERLEHRHVPVADRQQPVVGDDDQGVDFLAQRVDTEVGLIGATTTLEGERTGDHTDGQGTEALGDLGDDGRAAGSGAAALASSDEDHVGPLENLFDVFGVVLGSLLADLGVSARTETAGELTTDLELYVSVTHQQRLRVGVDGDELDAFEAALDHPVDRVHAATTDADDLDDSQVVLRSWHEVGPFERLRVCCGASVRQCFSTTMLQIARYAVRQSRR